MVNQAPVLQARMPIDSPPATQYPEIFYQCIMKSQQRGLQSAFQMKPSLHDSAAINRVMEIQMAQKIDQMNKQEAELSVAQRSVDANPQDPEALLGKRSAQEGDSEDEDSGLEERLARFRQDDSQTQRNPMNSVDDQVSHPQHQVLSQPQQVASVERPDFSSAIITAAPVLTKAFLMTKEKATSLVPRAVLAKRKQQEELEAQREIEDRLRAEMGLEQDQQLDI